MPKSKEHQSVFYYNYRFAFDTPYVTVTEFSRRTGMPENTIRKYIKDGHLPIIKKEKGSKGKVLINIMLEAQRVLQEENSVMEDGGGL